MVAGCSDPVGNERKPKGTNNEMKTAGKSASRYKNWTMKHSLEFRSCWGVAGRCALMRDWAGCFRDKTICWNRDAP